MRHTHVPDRRKAGFYVQTATYMYTYTNINTNRQTETDREVRTDEQADTHSFTIEFEPHRLRGTLIRETFSDPRFDPGDVVPRVRVPSLHTSCHEICVGEGDFRCACIVRQGGWGA